MRCERCLYFLLLVLFSSLCNAQINTTQEPKNPKQYRSGMSAPSVIVPLQSISNEEGQHAQELRALRNEIKALRQALQRQEQLLLQLVEQNSISTPGDSLRGAWVCYLNDRKAGGVVATGSSKFLALGRTLERCSEKKGYCREREVKCSEETAEN